MNRRPFFIRQPKWQIVFAEIFFLVFYAVLTERLGGTMPNRLAISFDFAIFMAGLIIWPFFFAQFVLPVRSPVERLMAFVHLVLYLFGEHGPAQRIHEGKLVQREGESRRKGRGVLIIDAASAAVLRTDVAFTRPVGPGIHFLNFNQRQQANEYVAGVVDLRIRSATIGPMEREDPFAAKGQNENEDLHRRRQEHRYETSGLTRDGIEIVPNLNVTFRLDARPGEGRTGYGYNPTSVWRAISGVGVDPELPSEDARRAVSWEWLPTRLAADVWREYLRMFTMEELFQETANGRTGREVITEKLTQRLTQARVPELNEFGRPTGRHITSPEYVLLMRRGLKVQAVSAFNYRMPPAVEEDLVRRWESSWLQHARQERVMLEYQRSYARESAQRQALCDFALASTLIVGDIEAGKEVDGDALLKMLLEGTLDLSMRDPQLLQRISVEKNELVDLVAWAQQKPDL